MKKLLIPLLAICLFSVNSFAYGPRGHQLVGAIADRRLARNNRAVARKVRQLLDGLTLAEAATLPDQIKSWDDCGSRPPSPDPVTDRTRINNELRAFVAANKCSMRPTHGEFHFTDVPVTGGEKYEDGTVGRGEFDIVQMIPFCIRVLRGEEPENNTRAITKTIAVILITHYLADIHQPLHVGAEFFNADGVAFHPTPSDEGFADQGGNKLTLFTFTGRSFNATGNLHSFWDGKTVDLAFGNTADTTLARRLASQTPTRWRPRGGVETWAVQMADDILPFAREARTRLQYRNIRVVPGAHFIESGEAREKRSRRRASYSNWAAGVARQEIHKGGWRLAAVLEESLR
jgi:hypothetical protein